MKLFSLAATPRSVATSQAMPLPLEEVVVIFIAHQRDLVFCKGYSFHRQIPFAGYLPFILPSLGRTHASIV